ncbi:MAG: transglycosylase domain-containing protein [Desulfotomaculales bacterium]
MFLLVVILVLGASGTAFGMVLVSLKDLPAVNLDNLAPNAATLIYDKDGNLVTEIGVENRVPVDIEEVPPLVKKTFLAAEDNRFYQHHGVDLRAIVRAAWHNVTSGTTQGGSTITQQLVKTCFLTPEQTFKRKIQEAYLAIQLERRYTKDEIFEMYLNWVYFGEGAYGIQAAAHTYFGKDVRELDLAEAAMLAGVLRGPSLYSPYRSPEAAVQRRNTVLDSMVRYGYISPDEAAEAKNQPVELKASSVREKQYPYPYFIDYVMDQLVAKYGEAKVFREGLKVYTTLDPKIQGYAEAALADKSNFPATTRDKNGILQPQGAAVVLDPHTGYIKAIVGGREHTQARQLNRATHSHRQPGSAFKPIFVYAPAVDRLGMGPASVIDDIPLRFPNWTPTNYDGRYRGLVTMRTAITWSINMPAIQVLQKVTLPTAVNFARQLGISTLHPDKEGLASALGGLFEGVTPLEMAGAYGAFANGGVYVEPTAIIRVEERNGTVLEECVPRKKRAMKPTTAWLITDMLRSVVRQGTGTAAQLGGRPVAGKTGTTDKRENVWFCGYTPELVGVVWIGYDDQKKPLPYGSYGGTYPARIWRQIMSQALAGVPIRDFPRPAGIVTATVDSKSGLLPGPNTPPEHQVTDYFAEGTVPTEVDNTHVLVDICPVSGLLAGEYCPERVAQVRVQLPYNVPEFVEDYNERVPPKTCDLHTVPTVTPVLPPGEEEPPVEPPSGGKEQEEKEQKEKNTLERRLPDRQQWRILPQLPGENRVSLPVLEPT